MKWTNHRKPAAKLRAMAGKQEQAKCCLDGPQGMSKEHFSSGSWHRATILTAHFAYDRFKVFRATMPYPMLATRT